MKIVGIDPSLTSTGLAIIDVGRVPKNYAIVPVFDVHLDRITTSGVKDATLTDRIARERRIVEPIRDACYGADLVVIEGPSHGQHRQGGQHDRAGLWWLIVDIVDDFFDVHVAEVPPANRAMYATGKGNAAKDQVLAAVVRRYPEVDVDGNDVADALILAAMGARALGEPIESSLPQTHLRAMDRVAWPEAVTDA